MLRGSSSRRRRPVSWETWTALSPNDYKSEEGAPESITQTQAAIKGSADLHLCAFPAAPLTQPHTQNLRYTTATQTFVLRIQKDSLLKAHKWTR
jgi:hypothetical protein